MQDPSQKEQNILLDLIASGKPRDYLDFFKQHHEADIAEWLGELPEEKRQEFFAKVTPEMSVEVLEELDIDQQIEIISQAKGDLAAKFIEEMELDDAADLLEELPEGHAQEILEALPEKEKSEIETLLAYEEGSAGALMTPEFVSIPEQLTIADALSRIKKEELPESELSFYIFIVGNNGRYAGFTTLRDLVVGDPKETVKSIRHDYSITVPHHDDQEDVARLFQKYDMSLLPVVDEKEILLGVITVDDVVDVVVDEANEDIYKLSGTTADDDRHLVSGNILKPILYRIPWLIITILGGLVASLIINSYSQSFQADLFPLALSLSFIPLLMGLGGNVGNQSSAIIVRGLATGYVKPHKALSIVGRELLIGCAIGSIIATGLFCINYFVTEYSLVFSAIVSVALVSNIIMATLIGSALPLFFYSCKVDPAVASAPFISTALDIIGQLIYFAITLGIIRYLAHGQLFGI